MFQIEEKTDHVLKICVNTTVLSYVKEDSSAPVDPDSKPIALTETSVKVELYFLQFLLGEPCAF